MDEENDGLLASKQAKIMPYTTWLNLAYYEQWSKPATEGQGA